MRDPAPKPQVALPARGIDLAAAVCNNANALPRQAATAHLIVMALYFLFRVGNYTLPPEHCTTHSVQFFENATSVFGKAKCYFHPPAMQPS
jgi:hypothetical protein